MKITPRKDEVAKVVEVINKDYKTAEDAAKAVLKAAAEILTEREDLMVALYRPTSSRHVFCYGPFGSPADADKIFEKGVGIGGEYRVQAMRPITLLGWRANGKASEPWEGFCANCLHPEEEHLWATSGPAKKERCGHNVNMLEDHQRCWCPGYKKV